jgi:hypothetical protein
MVDDSDKMIRRNGDEDANKDNHDDDNDGQAQ